MEAVGLDAGMEDFEIGTVEGGFSDMDETASNNNKTMDTAGHIKIEIELKYDPEEDFGNELSRARDDGIQEYSSDSTSNDLEGGLGLSSAGQSCNDLPDVEEQFETTIQEHRFSRYASQILSQQICPAGMSVTAMSTQKEGPVTTPPPQDLSRNVKRVNKKNRVSAKSAARHSDISNADRIRFVITTRLSNAAGEHIEDLECSMKPETTIKQVKKSYCKRMGLKYGKVQFRVGRKCPRVGHTVGELEGERVRAT